MHLLPTVTRIKPRLNNYRQLLPVCAAALLLAAPGPATWAQTASTLAITNAATNAPSNPAGGGALPSLGDNAELTAGAERRIGDRIAASIYRDADYIDDAVLGDYLQSIWQPLLAAARARGELQPELDERFAFELFMLRDRSINAFALPGGYFGVHLGLIGVVTSRDELAAVLGHEMSHVTQRHISRLITQQSRQTPWIIGAMILGALAASKNPQAASAAVVGGQAVAAQSQLNFSRDMEREADRVGFSVMTDAGFESRGVASMFEKLQQGARLNDNGAFPYLRSHPLTTQRIAEAQLRVQSAPPQRPAAPAVQLQSAVLHAMMAARARVLVDPGVDGLRAMVEDASRTPDAAQGGDVNNVNSASFPKSASTLYAGAMAAARQRNFTQAFGFANRLKALAVNFNPGPNPSTNSSTDPNVAPSDVARATDLLLLELHAAAGTLPPGAGAIDLGKTDRRAELLTEARTLLAAGKPQAVSNRLITWVTAHPKDAPAWQLLAVAYGNQNQTVRAIRADAEARAAQLDYTGALDRLRAAQDLMRANPGAADYVEGSIIDTRARQVDSLVKEQALQDKLDR